MAGHIAPENSLEPDFAIHDDIMENARGVSTGRQLLAFYALKSTSPQITPIRTYRCVSNFTEIFEKSSTLGDLSVEYSPRYTLRWGHRRHSSGALPGAINLD